MPSSEELTRLAEESVFIFAGLIARTAELTVSQLPADVLAAAVVSVGDVIKSPAGLRGLAVREVTVQLRHHLEPGDYVFFADPLSIGNSIVVKEKAHLSAIRRMRRTSLRFALNHRNFRIANHPCDRGDS